MVHLLESLRRNLSNLLLMIAFSGVVIGRVTWSIRNIMWSRLWLPNYTQCWDIYLQSSGIISFFFSFTISFFWLYPEPILILLHQDPNISKQAALYKKVSYSWFICRHNLLLSHLSSSQFSHLPCIGHPLVSKQLHWQLHYHYGYRSFCWQSMCLMQRNCSIRGKDFLFNRSVSSFCNAYSNFVFNGLFFSCFYELAV